MTGHALQIRQHYVYLLDVLDTKYSGLLGELFSTKVHICRTDMYCSIRPGFYTFGITLHTSFQNTIHSKGN